MTDAMQVSCREPPAHVPCCVHKAGMRVPRLKKTYGPRVTGGNPAWEGLGRR